MQSCVAFYSIFFQMFYIVTESFNSALDNHEQWDFNPITYNILLS